MGENALEAVAGAKAFILDIDLDYFSTRNPFLNGEFLVKKQENTFLVVVR